MIYQSGSPAPQGTTGQVVVKEYQMLGQTGSTAAGSYNETAITREIWAPDAPVQLLAVYERHSVQGSTLIQVVKATGSTPLGSALNVLSTTMDTTTATDIVQSGTLYASTGLTQATLGDAFGLRWSTPGNKPPEGKIELVLQYL